MYTQIGEKFKIKKIRGDYYCGADNTSDKFYFQNFVYLQNQKLDLYRTLLFRASDSGTGGYYLKQRKRIK